MDKLSDHLSISYYNTVATINEAHRIYLVRHSESGRFFVKKILEIYSPEVYNDLRSNPVRGIPKIYDMYESDGTLTLIEEYVAGETLEEKIASGTLSKKQIIRYSVGLCEILEKLHSHNPPMIHRDIKPSNIMITAYDNVMLLDFNAAKYRSNDKNRQSDTVLLGTHGYAAPEQYGFGESSTQTDLYSVGIIIKESASSIGLSDRDLNMVISKCTQMDPSMRFDSAGELISALNYCLKNDPALLPESVDISSYLPPGFRSMTPWKMIIAIPVYIMIFIACLTLSTKAVNSGAEWLERIFLFLILLGDIFIDCNYLGIQHIFPPCRSSNKWIRMAGIISFIFIYSLLMLLIMVLIESFFFDPS